MLEARVELPKQRKSRVIAPEIGDVINDTIHDPSTPSPFSAKQLGVLFGVSFSTIYMWINHTAKPSRKQVEYLKERCEDIIEMCSKLLELL